MPKERYYEDFEPGQEFKSSDTYTIDKDDAIAFAKEFDPQIQHIDEARAADTTFGRLVVSGWHTAAASMRLKTLTDLFNVAGGLIGIGVENIGWPRPTLPGDTLNLVITILEKRTSNSRPDKGLVKYKMETFNQRGDLAMSSTVTVIVPRRSPER